MYDPRGRIPRIANPGAGVSNLPSALYVVATPIGHLGDMTPRAVEVLSAVDWICAEDTRHSAKLLKHFGIATKTLAVHEHNEPAQVPKLLALLKRGQSLALISDAGTPLVSDPGFRLVRALRAAGIPVVPVPGACAAIAALSVSGLPCDRFVFEGFPPARGRARRTFFEGLRHEARTLIFYEAPHRVAGSLAAMAEAFGPERPAVFARELTKQFETLRAGTLAELAAWVRSDPNQQRGEIVVVVQGAGAPAAIPGGEEPERVLAILLGELPTRQAVSLAAQITGGHKNALYEIALRIK